MVNALGVFHLHVNDAYVLGLVDENTFAVDCFTYCLPSSTPALEIHVTSVYNLLMTYRYVQHIHVVA